MFHRVRNQCLLLVAATPVAFLSGCGSEPEIRAYSVARELTDEELSLPESASSLKPARMLATMVDHDDKTWFFKAEGSPDSVAAIEKDVRTFLETVRFDNSDGTPTWDLPDDWEQRGASQTDFVTRFATLRIPAGDDVVDMTVIPLNRGDQNQTDWVLVNVNRWRGQVQLPGITAEEIPNETQEIEIAGTKSVFVNLLGVSDRSGKMKPPFANATPAPATKSNDSTPVPAGPSESE